MCLLCDPIYWVPLYICTAVKQTNVSIWLLWENICFGSDLKLYKRKENKMKIVWYVKYYYWLYIFPHQLSVCCEKSKTQLLWVFFEILCRFSWISVSRSFHVHFRYSLFEVRSFLPETSHILYRLCFENTYKKEK